MKQSLPLFILLSFFLFTNCENTLDCIINVRPVLPHKSLEIGLVNRYYSEIITAEIKNEPRDNDYEYYYEISGEIPEGLEVIFDYRDVIIEGTPLKSGRFSFTIYLDVDPPYSYYYDDDGNERYNDDLCSDNTSKRYTIAIK